MKKLLSMVLIVALMASVFVGCNTKEENDAPTAENGTKNDIEKEGEKSTDSSKEAIQVEFWSAPNQNQLDFWTAKAETFNQEQIESNGKIIEVKVQMIPESASSEAAIQNAIATGTAPAVSENISLAFATVLADSDVIYDISGEEFVNDIIENRDMSEAMKRWKINDKDYIIPLYVNAVSLLWNVKALEQLGFDEPPKTMDQYENLIQAFMNNREEMKDMGIEYMMSNDQFTSTSAYKCGYDFQMMYSTYASGENWIENNSFVMDTEAAKKALEFWGMLGNTLNVAKIEGAWTQDEIPVVFDIGKPWSLVSYKEAGKIYGEDFVYGPVPTINEGDQAYNYGDTKGITFYKTDNITEEVHQGAVEFIQWVYNETNSANTDYDWLMATNMFPVRGDLLTNDKFTSLINENADFEYLANNISYAVPLPSHLKAEDMEVALRELGLVPYMLEAINNEPLDVLDSTSFIEEAMSEMKELSENN